MGITRLAKSKYLAGACLLVLLTSLGVIISSAGKAGAIGSDWASQTLPAGGYVVATDGSGAYGPNPVSCVSGTTFCVAVVTDTSVSVSPVTGEVFVGHGDVVTSDGTTWSGYDDIPSAFSAVNGVSCPATDACWIAGVGFDNQAEVAESTDGGQTWTLLETPTDWQTGGTWWANEIDCPDSSTCWIVGQANFGSQTPAAAETTNGGATWTTFSNLPTPVSTDGNGDTYALNGISCVSDLSCVAAGGVNESNGTATVISTTDGGATWSISADPALQGIQQFMSISCTPTSGLPSCTGVGSALGNRARASLTSSDGGATWTGAEFTDDTGWLDSVSCASVSTCWAASEGSTMALAGTTDGGTSWTIATGSVSTNDYSDDYGQVSCASVDFCVATQDNALWATSDDGGLSTSVRSALTARSARPRVAPATQTLPAYSSVTVNTQSAHPISAVGQDRLSTKGTTVSVSVHPPTGASTTATTKVALNDFYSWPIADPLVGKTTVEFSIGTTPIRTVTIVAHPDAAPVVRRVTPGNGPSRGGATITVHGGGFSGSAAVDFGPKAASHVHVVSGTELTATSPAGSGEVNVTVVTSGGGPSAVRGLDLYNYASVPQVNALNVTSGPTKGGNSVNIRGPGLVWATAVHFGKALATHLKILSATIIQVRVPAGTGTVNVVVTAAGGTTAVTSKTKYTYEKA